jgi:hypothetical protein
MLKGKDTPLMPMPGVSPLTPLPNNDDYISLESTLDLKAQSEAKRIYGFNENHVTILFSEQVGRVFNHILDKETD